MTTISTNNNDTTILKPLVQRLKQKKKQLTARVTSNDDCNKIGSEKAESQACEMIGDVKRKNPFATLLNTSKRFKSDIQLENEDSLLEFINKTTTNQKETAKSSPCINEFTIRPFNAVQMQLDPGEEEDEEALLEKQKYTKHLPIDWCLKTRVRFFCVSELPPTQLKTNQAASGLTSFVRCINTQSQCNGLDISPASRFNQATYYWQHPHIPWMTLFPRNSRNNCGFVLGEKERAALAEEWDYSFKGLFQLLRARQCPYFYLCANSFTVLFRAPGIGGRAEIHALMSPSTHGIRQALRQEGIEYTMPLKKETTNLNKSLDNEKDAPTNGRDENAENLLNAEDNDDDEEEWLESLGVDEKEIRKIKTTHLRKLKNQELSDDFTDNSLLLIEGVECQGFFSFLLNAKSTISPVGRLAGVPPTLLAPVAFPKATMQHLSMRSNKVRLDGSDYFSTEVKGVILPSFLPYICQLLKESKSTFSATMASSVSTLSFAKATQKLLEYHTNETKSNKSINECVSESTAEGVFHKENLSDCGLQKYVIEDICRTGQHAVALLERICYNKEYGYAWS